jgi:hypothetical protein
MPDTREARSLVQAAERAAEANEYVRAEQLLREAAILQEADLGPLHPDLANTLNNLGVVCEIAEKPVDAEHFFRRAYAIATSGLQPDHPFVATSRKNLEDFCAARGIAVDALIQERPPERSPVEESPQAAQQVPSRPSSRRLAIGALIAGALLLSLIGSLTWFRSHDRAESTLGSSSLPPARDPIPANVPTVTNEAPHPPPVPAENRNPETSISRPPVVASRPPLVAVAHVCSSLSTRTAGSSSDWQCASLNAPAGPGSLYFYTRLKSPTDTTVQHRWYRGNRLFQVVELSIRANTSDGYRTYSRATVNNESPADWRVELRTKDGDLLHEQRFAVR